MKLTPTVNFTSILRSAFAHADPKNPKDTDDLTFFFCAFGIFALKNCEQTCW